MIELVMPAGEVVLCSPNSPDLGLLAGRPEIKTRDEVLVLLQEKKAAPQKPD